MTKKSSTPKTVDPNQLSHPDFRWFLMYFPDVALEKVGLQRDSIFSVGMALAQFGNYDTGTGIRVSKLALANFSGKSRNTVKRVLDLFKAVGAIEVVDHQKRGGTPSENYRLRKSPFVTKVLEAKDQALRKQEPMSVSEMSTQNDEWSPDEHSVSRDEHSVVPDEHDKNSQNEKELSVAKAPSPPIVAQPSARDEAEEEMDEIDLLLAGVEEDKPKADLAHFYQLAGL